MLTVTDARRLREFEPLGGVMAPRGESHELQHDASPTVFVERAHAVRLRIDDLCQRRLAERWHSGARIEHCGLDEEFYCDSLDDGDVVLAAAGAARAGLVVEDELRHVLLLAREASRPQTLPTTWHPRHPIGSLSSPGVLIGRSRRISRSGSCPSGTRRARSFCQDASADSL